MARTPRILAALLCFALGLSAISADARTIIRDPDIEHALAKLARPLILAAGLNPSRVRIVVLQDDRMNAFVADDQHVFLNSGMLLRLDRAAEVQAVIAHELAHIANGHLTNRRQARRAADTAAGIAIGLAVAAATATDNTRAGGALGLGAASSAQRSYLAHSRAEEASADASALRYMVSAGVDPSALSDVLDLFRGQEALVPSRQDPYVRAHPLTRDRIRNAEGFAAAYADKISAENPDADYWFARARGKLSAFLRNPKWTLRRVEASDESDIARLRRAVAYHLTPDPKRARQEIDALAAKRPNDPFVHELRGQILLESRDFRGAIGAYQRAANLAPGNALILAGYGRALLTAESTEANRRALEVLSSSRSKDAANPRMLRDLALAYARSGQNGMASVTTAERLALIGRLEDALIHAERATDLLPQGSPGWRRAADIVRVAKTAE